MKSRQHFVALSLTMAVVSLHACDGVTGTEAIALRGVQIVNTSPKALTLDEFKLWTAKVVDDSLELFIQFGGGCKDHDFALYATPDLIIPTNPQQAMLVLRHDANGDRCMAWVPATLRFDLSPLSERLRQLSSEEIDSAAIVLHVFDYELKHVISVVYEPQ